ncbi:hypothetical protein MauCBS54593_006600 [Microsporum audouinii]
MRVVIVGWESLTLASALEKASVDFVLLEARGRFDSQVGAFIGLNAAALRILDQLGAANSIMDETAPIKVSKVHCGDGKPALTFPILRTRFGYGACFLDRHRALRALIDLIRSKDNMLPNKTASRIDQTGSGVSVHCQDGSPYHGDVVVVMVSIASTRSEMCRLAGEEDPGHFLTLNIREQRVTYTLVPLEEALFDMWSWGRIATVGDNSHKMTPNTGQARNNAIESAAALANQLQRFHDEPPITSQKIKSVLRKWQEKRQARVNVSANTNHC